MIVRFFILSFSLFASLCAMPLMEQFARDGYIEICDRKPNEASFESLYIHFDEFLDFLQQNPMWAQKLYTAKERFIRSKDRNLYSTDFFGLYDESKRIGRDQISFYYSLHYHEFITAYYPEIKRIPEITRFLDVCHNIQKPCVEIFEESAIELGVESVFSSEYSRPPILFKVVKYLPSYKPAKPHYDGAVLSILLDSTDNDSLLLSSYQPSLKVEDFHVALRECSNSCLMIPGSYICEYSIYPTPHIVTESGKIRYAAVAFAMRPHFNSEIADFFPLPFFKN